MGVRHQTVASLWFKSGLPISFLTGREALRLTRLANAARCGLAMMALISSRVSNRRRAAAFFFLWLPSMPALHGMWAQMAAPKRKERYRHTNQRTQATTSHERRASGRGLSRNEERHEMAKKRTQPRIELGTFTSS